MNNIEDIFKDAAALYTKREGAEYQRELLELENETKLPSTAQLDQKVRKRISELKRRQLLRRIVPAAAVLTLFFLYSMNVSIRHRNSSSKSSGTAAPYSNSADQSDMTAQSDTTDNNGVTLLSAKLPEGYRLNGIDYDQSKTIYYIDSNTNNPIVLLTEQNGVIETSGFSEIQINSQEAYVLIKKDYSVLIYENDGLTYTMSSPYDYRDLIKLSENLI